MEIEDAKRAVATAPMTGISLDPGQVRLSKELIEVDETEDGQAGRACKVCVSLAQLHSTVAGTAFDDWFRGSDSSE